MAVKKKTQTVSLNVALTLLFNQPVGWNFPAKIKAQWEAQPKQEEALFSWATIPR